MTIVPTPKAESDIKRIVRFFHSKARSGTANRFLVELELTFNRIAALPDWGVQFALSDSSRPIVRFMSARNIRRLI